MKPTILLLIFTSTIIVNVFGQDNTNFIKMTSEYLTDNPDLNDLLIFEGIEYYSIKFSGAKLKVKKISLSVKEIWNGEITKVDTLINSRMGDRIGGLTSEELKFKVIGKRVSENEIKMMFKFPWFQMDHKFKSTNSEFYSLRDVGVDFEIEPSKPFMY